MADVIKRLKYYNGQFLQEPDFTAEQEYHLDRQRRHNRQLHVPGIAHGLTVTVGTSSVVVAPGTAIDDKGQQIVLHEPRTVGFEDPLNGQWVLVVISYEQVESDMATVGEVGDRGPTRFTEVPKIDAVPDDNNAPLPGERIRLARLRLDSGGTIVQQDMNVRTPAGARLRPEETLERLRLSRQGVPEGQWPVLSSGAANRADVTGDLNVTGNVAAVNLNLTGNIVVTGTVDGRDVSADASLNESHRSSTNNPHNVTALQVGAIASVAGMTSPGGNIAVTGLQGITVSTDVGTKTVKVAGGSPTSIAGVSNPGGNIPIIGNGITVGAAGGAINLTTSAAAIGALPVGQYLQRTTASQSYWETSTNGSFSTIYVGFTPKMIWVSGRTYAQVINNEDLYFGGLTYGHCVVNAPGSIWQIGHGPTIRRFPLGWSTGWSIRNHQTPGIAVLDLDDKSLNPRVNLQFQVSISDVTSDSIVLYFTKSFGGYSSPYFAYMGLYFTILG